MHAEECLVVVLLPYLGRVTDGIEFHVMLFGIDGSVFFHHGFLKELSNRTRFFLVHGRLIGQSNFSQHGVRIESWTDGFFKVFQKRFLVTTIDNVIGNHFGFFQIFDTNVIFAKRNSSNCFFVSIFAMNDRRQTFFLMFVDGIPYFGHPWTGRVNNFHILFDRSQKTTDNHEEVVCVCVREYV